MFEPEAQFSLSPPASSPHGRFGGPYLRALAGLCLLIVTGLISACGESSRAISIVGPTPPTLTSITVTPANSTIKTGSTLQFIATGLYSDGTGQNITATVAWTSSTPSVATISNTSGGLATAVATGTTTITASLSGISSATTLNVTSATLLSINVTPATVTVPQGGTQQFVATGVYSDNTTQVLTTAASWHGVNPAVATVSNAAGTAGLATAVGPGTTQVTASFGGLIGSAAMTVTAHTLVSIAVTPANSSLPKGKTQPIIATGTFSDNTTQNLTGQVTWVSGNPGVAAVSAAGGGEIATAVTLGTTTLTATLGAVSGSTNITVIAPALVSIAVTPASPVISVTQTLQMIATGTYTDATTAVITNTVTWTSGTMATATITNPGGLATGVAVGTTLITATDPATTIAGSTTLTVAPAFAYALNFDTGVNTASTVSEFSIDGATGQLTPLPASNANILAGVNPFSVTVDPQSRYLYVANYNAPGTVASTISQYSIGADGSLSDIGTGSVTSDIGPNGITISPSGAYVYVANFSDNGIISQFNVGVGGGLTPMAVPSSTAGRGPASVAVHPSEKWTYVANFNDGSVSQFAIGTGATAGQLTQLAADIAAGANANWVAVHPSGNYVYVANYGASTISAYSVRADGTLMALPAPHDTVPAQGNGTWSITIDAAGVNAYVANRADLIAHFSIDPATGYLTFVDSLPTPGGSGPTTVAIDPSGRYAYISYRGSTTVGECAIQAGGSLAFLTTAPQPVPSGQNPVAIAVAR